MGWAPRPCPYMDTKIGHTQFLPKCAQYGAHSKALGSPEFSHIKISEIGPKMTELWPKNVCPYMAAHPIFEYILALK